MFFLGAGASVPADISDVRGLVENFRDYLKSESKSDYYEIVTEIEEVLKNRLSKANRKVDIELLLETVEKLENREREVLLDFYHDKWFALSKYEDFIQGNKSLSREIKRFIRMKCNIDFEKTSFLEPLQYFINEKGNPLPIFTTNYDTLIEQFCERYNKQYVDGMDSKWNATSFRKKSVDIQLFKVHGSITWYRNIRGDTFKIPITTRDEELENIHGDRLVPLILYPGRKLEYIGPVFDILAYLKKLLNKVEYVFVIGYAFKDDQITKLFQYAARTNGNLTLFLVGPHSHVVYNEELKIHKDIQFPDSFTLKSANRKSYTTPELSKLKRRVICLPYKFEKVIHLLKNYYLKNLQDGQTIEQREKFKEASGEKTSWHECLLPYLNSEHAEKVLEIMKRVEWDKIVRDNWQLSFEVSFRGLLNSLLSEDEESKSEWRQYFLKVSEAFSVEKFDFQPSISPKCIELMFRPSNLKSTIVADYLVDKIIPITKKKLDIVATEKLNVLKQLLDQLNSLTVYLRLWDQNMDFENYYRLRSHSYSTEISTLRDLVSAYQSNQTVLGQRPVKDLITTIETKKILNAYGPKSSYFLSHLFS